MAEDKRAAWTRMSLGRRRCVAGQEVICCLRPCHWVFAAIVLLGCAMLRQGWQERPFNLEPAQLLGQQKHNLRHSAILYMCILHLDVCRRLIRPWNDGSVPGCGAVARMKPRSIHGSSGVREGRDKMPADEQPREDRQQRSYCGNGAWSA